MGKRSPLKCWNADLASGVDKNCSCGVYNDGNPSILGCISAFWFVQATKAFRESRGIALLCFLDLGTRSV
jgi:hypothetical protein